MDIHYNIEVTERVQFSQLILASSEQEAIAVARQMLADDDTDDFQISERTTLSIEAERTRY